MIRGRLRASVVVMPRGMRRYHVYVEFRGFDDNDQPETYLLMGPHRCYTAWGARRAARSETRWAAVLFSDYEPLVVDLPVPIERTP